MGTFEIWLQILCKSRKESSSFDLFRELFDWVDLDGQLFYRFHEHPYLEAILIITWIWLQSVSLLSVFYCSIFCCHLKLQITRNSKIKENEWFSHYTSTWLHYKYWNYKVVIQFVQTTWRSHLFEIGPFHSKTGGSERDVATVQSCSTHAIFQLNFQLRDEKFLEPVLNWASSITIWSPFLSSEQFLPCRSSLFLDIARNEMRYMSRTFGNFFFIDSIQWRTL